MHCREFMRNTLAGILEVHLTSATGLPARDVSLFAVAPGTPDHHLHAQGVPSMHERPLQQVTCLKSFCIVGVQLWGSSDPYCVISVGESARRSRTVPRSLEPVWDEQIRLYVRYSPSSTLPS